MTDRVKITLNRMKAVNAYKRLQKDLIAMTAEGVIDDPELNYELTNLINRLEKRLIKKHVMDDEHNFIYPVQL